MNRIFMRDSLGKGSKRRRLQTLQARGTTESVAEKNRRGLTRNLLVEIAVEPLAQLVDFFDRERSDVIVEVRANRAVAGSFVVGQVLLPIAQGGEEGGQVTDA
jgi:hypothetical protein